MTTEPQPELRWAPLPPTPKRTGRIWLIVGLAVAALVIVAVVLFLVLPRDDAPAPAETPSPSPSASVSPSETPSPTPTSSTAPTEVPVVTPPPVADPSIDVFRDQVSGWLGDAPRGLDIIAGTPGPDALPVLDTLQEDAQRLSDAVPPSSLDQKWRDGVSTYTQRLTALRTAMTNSSGVSSAIEAARSAVGDLRAVVGL